MFRREPTSLEMEIDRVTRDLNRHLIDSDEYASRLTILERLQQMDTRERPKPVSRDTIVVVAANLIGIILIINHEYAHPITSRAMNLLLKPRA